MSNDAMERIKCLCKGVGYAKKTLAVMEKDLEILSKKIDQAKTDREKRMLLDVVKRKEREKKEAEEIVCSFMEVVDGLEEEERNVMLQLYVKKLKRDEVKKPDGKQMPMQEVDTLRKRSLRRMANYMMQLHSMEGCRLSGNV